MAAHGPVSRDVLGTVHVDVGAKASVLYSGRDLAQVFQVAGEKTQAKLKDGYARPDGTPTPAAEALTEENFRIRFTERARLGRNYHA
jgi:hypothetical protein